MLEEVYRDASRCGHLHAGPLAPYVDAFVATERQRGYALLTLHEHLRVYGALSTWLGRRRLEAEQLDDEKIDQFLRWRRRACSRGHRGVTVVLRILAQLRAAGIAPPPKASAPRSGPDRLAAEFGHHLEADRGLASSTVVKYEKLVRHFLTARFGTQTVRVEVLQARDVRGCIAGFAERHGRSRARDLANALRAFLRWLHARELTETDLATCVLGAASWRLTSVPTTLTQQEVRRLLRACDRHTAKGRRDYAVLLLLARLGLRASEVVALRLEHIDWRRAELTLRRKPGREDRLPLPRDVGEALVAYLRHTRPACAERHAFLCMNAPYRPLGHSSTVSSLVAAALERAGLRPRSRGAHLLRHTLASELLRRGATLSEIGGLLGHRSSAATEIYTKVDITALRTVAQPWPGGSR